MYVYDCLYMPNSSDLVVLGVSSDYEDSVLVNNDDDVAS